MDAAQTEKLKAMALAATQGTWEWEGRCEDGEGYVYIPECSYLVGNICLASNYENDVADCEYIAAANPATVLELIAEVERLQADLETAVKEAWRANSELSALKVAATAAGTEKDAERYRFIRAQNWSESEMAVVCHPKKSVKLGFDCPSGERLDAAIDVAIKAHTKAREE